jgi:hypothetical protein
MVTLQTISYYPIKACHGFDVTEWKVAPRGLEHDRLMMITDPDGMFFTQRELPRLATITPKLDGERLVLSAPGMNKLTIPIKTFGAHVPVTVWHDSGVMAIDQGEVAADWLSTYLKTKVRLMRMADDYIRKVSAHYAISENDHVSFADGYPMLITSQEGLDDLNARMAVPIPMNRFRPNIVVKGCEPFAEDKWKRIKIGKVELAIVKPCARCDVPTHDQDTGLRLSNEPTATLAQFRNVNNKVMFGQNVIPLTTGTIKVGMKVEVLE